jgi:integrase/recombinase XerD
LAQLLGILRIYWRLVRPKEWLFPGRHATAPIDVQVLYSACRYAAGIDKRVTVHTRIGRSMTAVSGASSAVR